MQSTQPYYLPSSSSTWCRPHLGARPVGLTSPYPREITPVGCCCRPLSPHWRRPLRLGLRCCALGPGECTPVGLRPCYAARHSVASLWLLLRPCPCFGRHFRPTARLPSSRKALQWPHLRPWPSGSCTTTRAAASLPSRRGRACLARRPTTPHKRLPERVATVVERGTAGADGAMVEQAVRMKGAHGGKVGGWFSRRGWKEIATQSWVGIFFPG
jgi:hypothetical protein